MASKFPEWICCPACYGTLHENNGLFSCTKCGKAYPVQNGIPLLVATPEQHETELQAAREVNPGWYEAEQPPEQNSPWKHHLRKRREYVQSILQAAWKKRGGPFSSLLDLGCGDGNNLVWLKEFATQTYGSDYNMLRCTRAQLRCPEAIVYCANILQYPVADHSIDCVFFNHVIEHIQNDIEALQVVRRILKPGGLLVLGAPNEGCWWWQLAYKREPRIAAYNRPYTFLHSTNTRRAHA